MTTIVDAHAHLLPDRLAAKIRRFFEERGAPRMPYPHAPLAAREALAAAGIARCWNLPYAHRGGVASPLNRWMAQTWAGDPFVVAGAPVPPDDDVAAAVPSVAVTIEDSLARVRIWNLDPADEDAVLGGTANRLLPG